jgi:exonuclease SbcD
LLKCIGLFVGKVDYFALGHIHSRQEQEELCYNPGAPETVHIDEEKKGYEKGFYHVTVKGREKEVRFVPSKRRPVYRLSIDLSGLAQPDMARTQVLEYINLQSFDQTRKPILQLNLNGTVNFSSYAIDTKGLEEELKENYNFLAVEVLNNTNLPELDGEGGILDFDRTAIEKHVLREMIGFEKPELKDYLDQVVDLVLGVKRDVLAVPIAHLKTSNQLMV